MDIDTAGLVGPIAAVITLLVLAGVCLFVRRNTALRSAADDVDAAWYRYALFCARLPLGFSIFRLTAVLGLLPIEVIRTCIASDGSLPAALTYAIVFTVGLLSVQLGSILISHAPLERLGGPRIPLRERSTIAVCSVAANAIPLWLLAISVAAFSDHRYSLFGAALIAAYACPLTAIVKMRSTLGIVTEPLTDGEFKMRIFQMAGKVRAALKSGTIMYTGKYPLANAFALHGGSVSISEQLLSGLTRREADAVMAHEITHIRYHHPLMYRAYIAYVAILAPIAIFVVLVQQYPDTTGYTWATPLIELPIILVCSAISRRCERICDRGAAGITSDPEALLSGLNKLYTLNRVPKIDSRWRTMVQTHPSLSAREQALRATGRLQSAGGSARDGLADTDTVGTDEPYPLPVYPSNRLPLSNSLYRQKQALANPLSRLAALVLPTAIIAAWAQQTFRVRCLVKCGFSVRLLHSPYIFWWLTGAVRGRFANFVR